MQCRRQAVTRQTLQRSSTLGHPPFGGGGGTTSDTTEQQHGGAPATNIARGGRTREEGEVDPLVELSDVTHCPTLVEAAEAKMAEARAGKAGGGGGHQRGRQR